MPEVPADAVLALQKKLKDSNQGWFHDRVHDRQLPEPASPEVQDRHTLIDRVTGLMVKAAGSKGVNRALIRTTSEDGKEYNIIAITDTPLLLSSRFRLEEPTIINIEIAPRTFIERVTLTEQFTDYPGTMLPSDGVLGFKATYKNGIVLEAQQVDENVEDTFSQFLTEMISDIQMHVHP